MLKLTQLLSCYLISSVVEVYIWITAKILHVRHIRFGLRSTFTTFLMHWSRDYDVALVLIRWRKNSLVSLLSKGFWSIPLVLRNGASNFDYSKSLETKNKFDCYLFLFNKCLTYALHLMSFPWRKWMINWLQEQCWLISSCKLKSSSPEGKRDSRTYKWPRSSERDVSKQPQRYSIPMREFWVCWGISTRVQLSHSYLDQHWDLGARLRAQRILQPPCHPRWGPEGRQ